MSTTQATVEPKQTASTCDLDDGGVEDLTPVLHPNTILLWPPNHKLHDIAVDDCVDARDACGRKLTGEFVWASCDEPENDLGDGNTAPDIVLGSDCKQISVRSERQGPSDGRVYKLGVRVFGVDGSSAEAECQVIVAHDQGKGEGMDSGEAYHLTFDGTNGQIACGMPPETPSTPPPPPESSGQPLPS